LRNPAARKRIENARLVGSWMTTGPLSFGPRPLYRNGILAIGDAAGMIDPFTGTGIQVALRSAEALADSILRVLAPTGRQSRVANLSSTDLIEISSLVNSDYRCRYRSEFGGRMAVAGALRLLAFSPRAAGLAATLLAGAPGIVNAALRVTRLGALPRASAGPKPSAGSRCSAGLNLRP